VSMTDRAEERVAKLERRLDRARAENQVLERLIEDKTRSLYLTQCQLRDSKVFLENVLASMSSAVMITDVDGRITSVGGTTARMSGLDDDELVGTSLFDLLSGPTRSDWVPALDHLCLGPREAELRSARSGPVPVLLTTSPLTDENGGVVGAVCVATDISERKQLEVELRHAQRLESIGQLAAGVAHEINTPIQFIGDSARFIGDAFEDLTGLVVEYRKLKPLAQGAPPGPKLVATIDKLEEEIDIEFVEDEAPKAIARTLDGIERVSSIVRALKQFAHPGDDDLAPTDLNQLIETTLTVAKNEYKYVAEIDLELGHIPDVLCSRGDLGQVLINLVVNAAHAIGDVVAESGGLGRITIRSQEEADGVLVDIADTGGGIPEEIRDRVFEPFFTTKEPGQGTGQGLALAHNIVVSKHGGRLDFDVEPGSGTTFHLWLPRKRPA